MESEMKATPTMPAVAGTFVLPAAASARSADAACCEKLASVWRACTFGAAPGAPGAGIPRH